MGVAEMSGTAGTPKSAPKEEKKVQTVRFVEGNSERTEAKDDRYFKNGSELHSGICQSTEPQCFLLVEPYVHEPRKLTEDTVTYRCKVKATRTIVCVCELLT